MKPLEFFAALWFAAIAASVLLFTGIWIGFALVVLVCTFITACIVVNAYRRSDEYTLEDAFRMIAESQGQTVSREGSVLTTGYQTKHGSHIMTIDTEDPYLLVYVTEKGQVKEIFSLRNVQERDW